jgi:hypothetical protein
MDIHAPQLKHGEIHSTVFAAAVLTGTQYALEVQVSGIGALGGLGGRWALHRRCWMVDGMHGGNQVCRWASRPSTAHS